MPSFHGRAQVLTGSWLTRLRPESSTSRAEALIALSFFLCKKDGYRSRDDRLVQHAPEVEECGVGDDLTRAEGVAVEVEMGSRKRRAYDLARLSAQQNNQQQPVVGLDCGVGGGWQYLTRG